MCYNTVEVFGGNTWSKIPENTQAGSSAPFLLAKCFLPAVVAGSHVFSHLKHTVICVGGTWGREVKCLYVIAQLAISLFLVPFCFSQFLKKN